MGLCLTLGAISFRVRARSIPSASHARIGTLYLAARHIKGAFRGDDGSECRTRQRAVGRRCGPTPSAVAFASPGRLEQRHQRSALEMGRDQQGVTERDAHALERRLTIIEYRRYPDAQHMSGAPASLQASQCAQ